MYKIAYPLLVVMFVSASWLTYEINKVDINTADTKQPIKAIADSKNTYKKYGLLEKVQVASTEKSSDDKAINQRKSPVVSEPSARAVLGVSKSNDKVITKDGQEYPLRIYKPLVTPNDPSYNQWWVASNQMKNVWDIPAGSYQTKIAVIDTGFVLNHQEFNGRWAINSGEDGFTLNENPSVLNCTDQSRSLNRSCNLIDDNFDGIVDNESGSTSIENPSDLNCSDQGIAINKRCNNIDDDGNGYIDDVTGWDFSNFDASVQAGEVNPNGSGTTHGTAVAGVLGATGNNGVGIAGVNWHTKILPIQALDDDSYGDTYTVSESIRYAADQDADIISISLGTSYNDPYLRQAMHYAIDKGSIIVAASGNDGCNCISYPANYPEVIAVGALAPNGNPASFSSYGANLDIIAPGQSITTPTFSASNQTSAYTVTSGTSFATPFTAGLLGLGKMSQPNAEWEEIIGAMFENADKRNLTTANPRSNTLGYGIVKSKNMLDRLRNPFTTKLRHQFNGAEVAGSERIYQCTGSTLASLPYFELKKSGIYRYTADLRELSKAVNSGWSSRQVFSTCIGLPTDNIDSLKIINIPREILNRNLKQ